MFHRLTSRRTVKWIGTIAFVLLALVIVASRWVYAGCYFDSRMPVNMVGIASGILELGDRNVARAQFFESGFSGTWFEVESPGFEFHANFWPRFEWWPTPLLRTARAFPNRWLVAIPLWPFALILSVPTLILWRIDLRRPRAGCCRQCNYNLTGNTSGRCPECGDAVYAATSSDSSAIS